MDKTEALKSLADNLHLLADNLKAVADAFGEVSETVADPQVTEEAPAPKSLIKGEANPAFIKLRATLREVLNHKGDAYGLICKYGASNLSDIEPEHYEAMQKEAEAMINGSN